MITIACPKCHVEFNPQINMKDTKTACPGCGEQFYAASMMTEEHWEELAQASAAPPPPDPALGATLDDATAAAAAMQAGAPAEESSGGDTFGHFRLDHMLSEHEYWITYKAFDNQSHRPVLLRVLIGSSDAAMALAEHISLRLEQARQIFHPSIAQIYDVGMVDDVNFVASEYIVGRPLLDLAREGPMPLPQAIWLVQQLAEAFEMIHSHNTVHGGICPASVLLSVNGDPRIVDLGLGSIRKNGYAEAGTPAPWLGYFPPERLAGDPPTSAGDIYGLGCLLCHLVTGRPPFLSAHPLIVIKEIAQDAPPRPSQLNHNVTPELEAVILRCLEKATGDRYRSATDLRLELERLRGGEPPQLSPAGSVRKATRTLHSSPWRTLSVLLLILAFAGIGWYFYRAADPVRRARVNISNGLSWLNHGVQLLPYPGQATELSDRMRNLAMRAKKMTARMPEVPNAAEIQARFEANGEKIQISEAEKLVEIVVEHRAAESANKAYGTARRLLKQAADQLELADRSGDSAALADDFARIHLGLGRASEDLAMLRAGEPEISRDYYQEARTHYNKVIDEIYHSSVPEDHNRVYLWRGYVQFHLGNHTAAAKDFAMSVKCSPHDAQSLQCLAMAQWHQGKAAEAAKNFQSALVAGADKETIRKYLDNLNR